MIGAILQGLGSGAILALVGVGLVLVFKGSKVLNLAQGEIGAFALFIAFALTGHGTAPASGITILVVTVVLAALLGVLMERVIMRPLVGRPPVQGTIASLDYFGMLHRIQARYESQGERRTAARRSALSSCPRHMQRTKCSHSMNSWTIIVRKPDWS